MQIVIEIDDDEYNRILKGKWEGNPLADYIENGTPLPKGHGRLIDADKIGLTNFECFMCNGDYKEALKMYIEKVEKAPTVLEIDKEV